MVIAMLGRSATILCIWACLAWLGCHSPPPAGPVMPGGTAGGAAITAAAAGVLWAVGGGCRLQGCPYGTYCDEKTGFCQTKKCSEGCPNGTVCNEGLDRCQVAPPPQTASDLLPQDNKIANPPGTH